MGGTFTIHVKCFRLVWKLKNDAFKCSSDIGGRDRNTLGKWQSSECIPGEYGAQKVQCSVILGSMNGGQTPSAI